MCLWAGGKSSEADCTAEIVRLQGKRKSTRLGNKGELGWR